LKEQDTEDGLMTTNYLVEIFGATTPRYMVVHIAYPTLAELIYAKRYTRKVLKDTYGDGDDDTPEDACIRLRQSRRLKRPGRLE
jgi:hypothetical protein